MKFKAFAVIDTNVIVSSIISENGCPAQVLGLIGKGNIIPIFDKRMLDEYYDVLNRKEKYDFSEQVIYETLYTIVNNGILINDVEQVKIKLKDAKDIPFFEVKESSKEFGSYLVTGNIKHFVVPDQLNSLDHTVTPEAMISIMAECEIMLGIFEKQFNYDTGYHQSVDNKIKQHLATSKYISGKELINKIFDSNAQTVKKSFWEKD